MATHILTIDVEDNFTFEELKFKSDWVRYEGQVVENTLKILRILKQYNTTATFFVVGYVASRHPEVIKYIVEDGHEVASHSYKHVPLRNMRWEEIEEDVKKSKEILENILMKKICGYRAMGYSIPNDKAKFYELLQSYGYLYDSSDISLDKTIINYNDNFFNISPSKINILGKKVIFSGGSYFRFLPMLLIKYGFHLYEKQQQPVLTYVHPWEFNQDQPKRLVSIKQKILQHPFTYNTEKRLIELLKNFRFVSIREYLGRDW